MTLVAAAPDDDVVVAWLKSVPPCREPALNLTRRARGGV
jgi:hypothetical protein